MLAAALLLPTAVVPLWDLAAKSAADDALPASSEALVAQINADNQGWTAAVPTEPMTRGMLRRMCGTELSDDFPDFFKPMPEEDILPSHSLADSLDARTKWPECLAVIGHVRNQGPCGCCWAFGATQSLQDRLMPNAAMLCNVLVSTLHCGPACFCFDLRPYHDIMK